MSNDDREYDHVRESFESYIASRHRMDELSSWVDYLRDDRDDLKKSLQGLGMRTAALLSCLSAHVGPVSPEIPDTRNIFIALRPSVYVFLDLVLTCHPKTRRMVLEAGLPTWSQIERQAAVVAFCNAFRSDYRFPTQQDLKCATRLLASIHVRSKGRVIRKYV